MSNKIKFIESEYSKGGEFRWVDEAGRIVHGGECIEIDEEYWWGGKNAIEINWWFYNSDVGPSDMFFEVLKSYLLQKDTEDSKELEGNPEFEPAEVLINFDPNYNPTTYKQQLKIFHDLIELVLAMKAKVSFFEIEGQAYFYNRR